MAELVRLLHMLEHGAVLELAVGNPLVEDIVVDMCIVLVVVVRCNDPCEREGDLESGRAHVLDTYIGVVEGAA